MLNNGFNAVIHACAPADGERPLLSAGESQLFHVSMKTVSRWRRQGLVGRRLLVDGRMRTGFLQSCVGQFVADHAEPVRPIIQEARAAQHHGTAAGLRRKRAVSRLEFRKEGP